VKKYSVPATQIAPLAKLKSVPPKGKTIIYMQNAGNGPINVQMGDELTKAAALLGWKVRRLNETGTVAALQAAYTQALQLKPDAIVSFDGVPPSYFAAQLEQAKAQKIPVVVNATKIVVKFPIVGGTGGDLLQSRPLAAELAADSKCDIHLGYVGFQSIPVLKTFDDLTIKYLKHFCPNAKVTVIQNALSDIGSRTSSHVVSAIQADSTINYLTVDTGQFIPGLTAALRTAGFDKKVKLIGTNPIAENIEAVKNGTQAAWVGVNAPWFAWASIDSLARYFTGTPLVSEAQAPQPIHVLTKATYTLKNKAGQAVEPQTGVAYPYLVNQYKKTWLLVP
jgi:ribose transport system substrate-binding protein